MTVPVKVGLVDDGVAGSLVQRLVDARDFVSPARAPKHGNHGTNMAAIIVGRAGQTALYDARVFPEHGPATPACVAEGLDWLVEEEVELVNLSLGLRDDRDVLRSACDRALDRGVVLIAAAPARGPAVYPAAYHGVVRVTGDARCTPGEFTWLDSEQALVGACVGGLDHRPGSPGGGASCAVAHVTGELVRLRSRGVPREELLAGLQQICTYRGPERRG